MPYISLTFKSFRLLANVILAQAAIYFIATGAVHAQSIVLASTTSTEQSGLFAHLLPAFKRASGIEVKVVAVGTGQALDMARRGDADVLLVHDPVAEEKLVADGFGLPRRPVMFNDFVLLGPKADPARARGRDIALALQNIRAQPVSFVSRGDKSGTHAAELRFWNLAGVAEPAGPGYRACGCAMGAALNMAVATGAYVLADRASWLSFKNQGNLTVLVEGDQRLLNAYSVIVVNPRKHPHVNLRDAQAFAQWLTSPAGQAVIAGYTIRGESLFFAHSR